MDKSFDMEVREDVAGLGLVKGFKVGAAACDIRNKGDLSRLDLALVVSEIPADAAGVFTTNDVKASPVLLDIARLGASPKMRAIVANSGNANACTGARGSADAEEMCGLAAAVSYVPRVESANLCRWKKSRRESRKRRRSSPLPMSRASPQAAQS